MSEVQETSQENLFYDGKITYRKDPEVIFEEKMGKIIVNGVENKYSSTRNFLTWKPASKEPKAIVFVSHGLFEHALCYNEIAIRLAKLGYIVYGMDHYGHGKSEGERANAPNYRTMPFDFARFMIFRRNQDPSIPCFLLCHSMGTIVGILAAEKVDFLSGIVFSGAALFPGHSAGSPLGLKMLFPLSKTKFLKSMNHTMSKFLPNAPCAPLDLKAVSSNKERIERNKLDNRRCKPIILSRMAYVLLKSVDLAKAAVSNLNVPFLVLHGAEDTIALPKGSQFIFDHAKRKSESELHIFPGLKHEIFNESSPHDVESMEVAINFIEKQYNISQL